MNAADHANNVAAIFSDLDKTGVTQADIEGVCADLNAGLSWDFIWVPILSELQDYSLGVVLTPDTDGVK